MRNWLKFIYISTVFILSNPTWAVEFSHFELKGKLKQSARIKIQALKERSQNKSANESIKGIDPGSVEMAPILSEISDMLSGQYEDIGMDQTRRLLENHDMGGGVLNFSGFTWYKPMLNYNITANREVAPELFSSRWIVHDSFTIFIEAATLLTNLKEKNLINITDSTIGAFAGVTFTRTYHYYHFADTYVKGLTSDFSKLFMSFLKFNHRGALTLDDYEVIKKKDQFSFNAGGLIKAPVGNGMNLQAGVLVKTAYENEVMLHGVGPADRKTENEFLRVSIDKSFDVSANAHLSLQYDFFNLLKLTILSYDLEYVYGEANKSFLTFYQNDKEKINNSPNHRTEFSNIVRGNDNIGFWKSNITTMEKRIREDLNSKFSFLLFGTMKKRATEQIRIIKGGIEKVFFKNYSESVKYVQSFFSRLFSSVVKKIFDFDSRVTNKAEIKKQLIIEYEHIKELGAAIVDDEEKFSIRLNHYYQVSNTHKWYHKKYRRSAVKNVSRLTNLPKEIRQKIENKQLRGPIVINSTIEIDSDGLSYFNQLEEEDVTQAALQVCGVSGHEFRNGQFVKRNKRRGRTSTRSYSPAQNCALKLITRYQEYMYRYINFSEIDLMKFKKFIGYYFSKSNSISDISKLFGEDYIFLHGDFRAETDKGRAFQTFFKTGQFKGLGVIDRFKRGHIITPINAN
ncbi:MAG: hypothetical protein ACJAS4_003546 [Bacteriovoracaceae bacterium]|jgi:hypothetical protein